MHQLHFVGVTDDHLGLVLADEPDDAARRFIVPVDDALLAALEDLRPVRLKGAGDQPIQPAAAPTRPAAAPSPKARAYGGARSAFRGDRPSVGTLSPREIQARLRTGRSVAEVAEEAGADDAWVERFAAPIRAEQEAAVKRAGDMTVPPRRRGPSAAPLGESVRRNLQGKGMAVDADDPTAGWSAFHQDGRQWVVRYTYRQRGRDIEADWLADLQAGSVVALNRPATALGYLAEPAAAEPAAAEPAATGSAPTGPAATGPGATMPAATGPAATVPAATASEAAVIDLRERPAPPSRPARLPGAAPDGASGGGGSENGAPSADLDLDAELETEVDSDAEIDSLPEIDFDADTEAAPEQTGDPRPPLGDTTGVADPSADAAPSARQPAMPESQPLF